MKVHYLPKFNMSPEDIRRVLVNFVDRMPKSYRKNRSNAAIVLDIILTHTGQAGFTSCCEVCEKVGCDPYAYEFPDWGFEDFGGRIEEVEDVVAAVVATRRFVPKGVEGIQITLAELEARKHE